MNHLRHHASSDGHVHWNLSTHPAGNEHFLTGVWVVGRVVKMLGVPKLLNRQLSHVFTLWKKTYLTLSSSIQVMY